ncbi:hypothetical protein, partial [Ralstonia pseudosolanacearum]|uniref:hypothetical protein n=1 Tax=Ralstonia pseudosolanacearum TaxID=1310165 RepID=UPI001E3CE066
MRCVGTLAADQHAALLHHGFGMGIAGRPGLEDGVRECGGRGGRVRGCFSAQHRHITQRVSGRGRVELAGHPARSGLA